MTPLASSSSDVRIPLEGGEEEKRGERGKGEEKGREKDKVSNNNGCEK